MKVRALTTDFVVGPDMYHKGDEFELDDKLAQLAIEAGCAAALEAAKAVAEEAVVEAAPKPAKKTTKKKSK